MTKLITFVVTAILAIVGFMAFEQHQEMSRQESSRTAARAVKLDACLAIADDDFTDELGCISQDANHEFDSLARHADWTAKVKAMSAKVDRKVNYDSCVEHVSQLPASVNHADAYGVCASKFLF